MRFQEVFFTAFATYSELIVILAIHLIPTETISLITSDLHNGVCVVSGNQLYANGYFVRRLTFGESKELAEYVAAIDEYNKMLREHLIDSSKPVTKWTFASRIIFPFEQRTMPRRPKAPSFCTAPDTHIHQFDGCIIQARKLIFNETNHSYHNYKVYIGSLFVRELDEKEKFELDEYNMNTKEYQDRIIENMKQKLGTMVSGVWYPYERELQRVRTTPLELLKSESEDNHNTITSFTETPKNEESTTTNIAVPLLQMPKPPKFCTQIF